MLISCRTERLKFISDDFMQSLKGHVQKTDGMQD